MFLMNQVLPKAQKNYRNNYGMSKLTLLFISLLIGGALIAQNSSMPHLEKQGNITRLIVNNKPFLILGGELHNSSTSGTAYMRPIWKRMAQKNLNTVIAPVYWELLEPEEGKFDFTLVDSMITGARNQNLHLVILWFGSWKNGYSMYVPGWVKNNQEKYPRAKNKNGESFQMLSAFGEASMNADAKAFRMLMRHVKEIDAKYQTVITVQIENEMGLFSTDRDYCDLANKAFNTSVPEDLLKYMNVNKGKLQPEIDSIWKANGYKTSGNWEEMFGKSIIDKKNWKVLSSLTEELFTVYHYAGYIEKIASAGKAEYPIPMYVNAWIKQPGMGGGYPGKYPSGGPIPHTLDVWRAAAPSVDFIAPDIYVPVKESMYTMEQYRRSSNPLFIPEYRHGEEAALLAFWAYGRYDALCFSPFAIDDWSPDNDPITKSYAVLAQVQDLILQHQGKGTMTGIYVDSTRRIQEFDLGGYGIKVQLAGTSIAEIAGFTGRSKKAQAAGGMIFNIGPEEFIVVGKDFMLSFNPLKPDKNKPLIDVEYLDEGTFINGSWVTTRRLNGDEGTGGGDYGFGSGNPVRSGTMRFQIQPDGAYSIIRFKMYNYK
jgi:beta-galactosidase GanA